MQKDSLKTENKKTQLCKGEMVVRPVNKQEIEINYLTCNPC